MQGVDNGNQPHPEGLDEMRMAAYSIEESLSKAEAPKGFCHNDLVPQNFIKTEKSLCLVDFDYAGITWIAVDFSECWVKWKRSIANAGSRTGLRLAADGRRQVDDEELQ